MTWLYVLASVVLFAAPLSSPLAQTSGMAPVMQALVEQSGVPNLVSGVILETRLFDTIGEVVVFTLASIGVRQLFREETKRDSIRSLTDLPSRVVCEQVATISSMVASRTCSSARATPKRRSRMRLLDCSMGGRLTICLHSDRPEGRGALVGTRADRRPRHGRQ